MTSELKVDKITPASGTSTQIGESGDTITIPSGCTITNSGSASGFGGAADNYFATSGLSNKDLGVGLHIKNSDTSGSVSASADQLVLEANSDMGMTMLAATSGECFINFGDSGDNDIGQLRYHHSTNHMSFHANAGEKMRIHSGGAISIGSTSVVDPASDQVGAIALQPGGQSTIMRPNNAPLSLQRSGSNGRIVQFFKGTTERGYIEVDASSTFYSTSSDYRLKENIVDINDGITRLKELKPRRFNWIGENDENGNPTRQVDGFVAHEVTAVPEAISGTKDEVDADNKPVYQGIDQAKLVPLLTAALQEAVTKIETLEAKVAALESK